MPKVILGKVDGEDGVSPHIGSNGNWFVGDVDTGIKARGDSGYTPVKGVDYFDGDAPHIGDSGNWFIGDVDTGIKAKGDDGYTPVKGVDYFDGESVSHSWDGTVLTISSAVGTSSADLRGPRGESGIASPVGGFFTLSVDDDGNLWVIADTDDIPNFEYDEDTGSLYIVQEE